MSTAGGPAGAIDRRMLATYLNDHLAAATAGRELARRASASNEGTPYGPALAGLAVEIEQDRAALRELMARLGVREDPLKRAFAWAGEKAGRLKPNNRLLSYSPLSRVIEVEALTAVVTAKRSLWRALERLAPHDTRIAAAGPAELAARAERQLSVLDELRPPAATDAFAPGTD